MSPSHSIFETPHVPALRPTVENLLRAAQVGDIVTWESIEASCETERSMSLYTACRHAINRLAKEGYKFATRHGIGYERLSDDQAATELLPKRARGVLKAARKLRKETEAIDLSQVSEANRASVVGHASLAAMAETMARPKSVTKLGSGAPDLSLVGQEFLLRLKSGNQK